MDRAFDARRGVVTEQHPSGGITTHRYVGEALAVDFLAMAPSRALSCSVPTLCI
ncbi:hypothetical protein sce1278 [Sorangium cellulosum So ce56]|uniref:Uncharacterized protein n=1 Tax=Sorangium cellulosum (strain So ce56) TaxID=448385 RepID=A9F6H9_SORC5|nr:hypothetical protein sce1278 [Sorangium cellulosum So ce56]